MDEEDLEADSIDLYQAIYLEADIYSDHCNAFDKIEHEQAEQVSTDDSNTVTGPSPHPFTDIPMPVRMLEISAEKRLSAFVDRGTRTH